MESEEPKKAKRVRVRRRREASLCDKEVQHEGQQLDFRRNYLNVGGG